MAGVSNVIDTFQYLAQGGYSDAANTSGSGRVYVSPSDAFKGDQGASTLLGKLSRAQWKDWKNRFAPKVDQLAASAVDPTASGDAAEQAKSSMGLAYDSAQQSALQQREAYGLSQNQAQQQSEDRARSVNRTAAMASAGNEARISAQDRQQSILAGGMGLSNIPDQVMNQGR